MKPRPASAGATIDAGAVLPVVPAVSACSVIVAGFAVATTTFVVLVLR